MIDEKIIEIEKLLEPYCDGGIRTIEGQMIWLQKKGFPQPAIEQAMQEVYLEVHHGKSFENGRELDHYLHEKAQRLWNEELQDATRRIKRHLSNLIGEMEGRVDKHRYIKAVISFVSGFITGISVAIIYRCM